MERKKLYRSQTDSQLGGVCGGIAEFFGIDSTVIRLAFVLLALLGGHGVLLYLILWLIMPLKSAQAVAAQKPADSSQ